MLAQERYEYIIESLNRDSAVKTSKLIKELNVSIETIRRDLEHLEKEGVLDRVYGGAVLKKITVDKLSFEKREEEFKEEKSEIASIAVRYIVEGQSIALNDSTTNVEIAKQLKNKFKNLTVITNSLAIATELANSQGIKVILAGGLLNSKEYAFYGEFAKNILTNFTVDRAFIGVGGVSLNRGITDYNIHTVEIQKILIEMSNEAIILADSSKIESVSLTKISNLEDISFIITDSKVDEHIIDKYLKHGVEIINK
ncbi:DeoR/GlpR transcriptional regulator [Romboutsia weinsteinii]|uniref:DeoR/GlpR transcriptional regulator n=1 Tax=Romboutsia weinsteinii TaxID=2020949 RepID=A0A371J773_9FIRM|nr:DeoR/GlpR family DNA-binding transcription regulator [Romboutsia weinsteinii]RDY28506.1 DeoR/GlpR transcriptional regulator [Romboutsia weinsteinii]